MSTAITSETISAQQAYQMDYNYVLYHCTYKGVQMFSLIVPPLALGRLLWKKQFTMNRWLRQSAIGTFGVGSGFGALAGWGRMKQVDQDGVSDRAYRLHHNLSQIRVDNFAMIGGFLSALGTTTIFLRRASPIWTLTGGGSLGIAAGIIYHVATSWSTMGGSPNAMVDELKDSLPMKRAVEDEKKELEKLRAEVKEEAEEVIEKLKEKGRR